MFCYCAQSRRLARVLTARYDAALAGAGITSAQFETLSVLSLAGPSSGRALAVHLALDKTTLSRNLKPLIVAAFVEAKPSELDARMVIYALSVAGRRRLAKAMPLWQAAHDTSVEMAGSQAAHAERTLRRMTQAFGMNTAAQSS